MQLLGCANAGLRKVESARPLTLGASLHMLCVYVALVNDCCRLRFNRSCLTSWLWLRPCRHSGPSLAFGIFKLFGI